jgi:hypothetical protein
VCNPRTTVSEELDIIFSKQEIRPASWFADWCGVPRRFWEAMGTLLDKPITEKETESGEANGARYGAAAMQGWRVEMEDQHCAVGSIPGLETHSFFAVFDGHGGKEAAIYSAKHILNRIQEQPKYEVRRRQQQSCLERPECVSSSLIAIATSCGARDRRPVATTRSSNADVGCPRRP